MDDFGTQNAFRDFSRSTESLRGSVDIFGKSVGTWAAGVYAFQKLVGGQTIKDLLYNLTGQEFSLSFSKVLKEGIPIIGIKSIVDTISELSKAIYSLDRTLAREMGLTGQLRADVMAGINREIQEGFDLAGTSLDKIYESYEALYDKFRDFSRPLREEGLVAITAAMADRFGLAMESSAEISYQLTRAGFTPDNIESMANSFEGMNVSNKAIGEQLAGASNHLYRMNLSSKIQVDRFKQMVGETARLGINLDNALSTMDRFRDLSESMQASVELSRWGVQMSPQQLMRAVNDPMAAMMPVLQQISQHTGPSGELTHIGIRMADQLGPIIGMDRREIQAAIERMNKGQELTIDELANMRKNAYESMTVQEKFQMQIDRFLWNFVTPVMERINPALEFIGNNADKVLVALLGYITLRKAWWTFEKAWMMKQMWAATGKQSFMVGGQVVDTIRGAGGKFGSAKDIGFMRRIQRMRYGMGHHGLGEGFDDEPISPRMAGRAARRGGEGMSVAATQQAGAQSQVIRKFPSAGQILSIGAALVMFGGALWIASKAFQNFSEVNWKGAIIGVGVMGSMVVAAKLLSSVSPQVLIGAATLAAVSGAMWIASKAFQNFSSAIEPLIGADLIQLGLGLAAIGGGMAILSSAQILGAFGALSSFLSGSVISRIGKDAERYSDPIENMANSFTIMADSLERIVKVSEGVKRLELGKMVKDLGNISQQAKALPTQETMVPLQNIVRIDIDGKKVAEAIYRSTARGR
jgi:hypothetical protein